jgi:hypothetical protein
LTDLILKPDEPGESNLQTPFSKALPVVATTHFALTFYLPGPLMIQALQMIQEKKTKQNGWISYLQVFELEGQEFWVIDDGEAITFLLPEDY